MTSEVLGVLWAKSDAGGAPNLLLQHLLDTAAVGELTWEHFLAPSTRKALDSVSDGQGRALLSLFCGLHDVGKATPAFQSKHQELAARVREAGLDWRDLDRRSQEWHHSRAGAVILRRLLPAAGWSRPAIEWVWPLVAGHHGFVPSLASLRPPGRGNAQGAAPWEAVQDELVAEVGARLGVDLKGLAPTTAPTRADQLALAGLLIMADWIASDERHFPGGDTLPGVSMEHARDRARSAWQRLELRGGWSLRSADPDVLASGLFEKRFGFSARSSQHDAAELAAVMPTPGMLILEAPMGEGKTESALAAVEVLAERFGADGVFVGMPTQATSDPMFGRVRRWAETIEPGIPIGLLHGKRRFNREWNELRRQVHFGEVDAHGGSEVAETEQRPTQSLGELPAEWFLGPKRGLLTPLTVGTVDQLLHSATRTRHVMLRHAGLSGSVVVLDEVHAYDVYMSQFLFEALRWLADAHVPVVLLTATLPPPQREALVDAYLQGALTQRDVDLSELPGREGYPSALSVSVVDGVPCFEQRASAPWRPQTRVDVELLEESIDGRQELVARHLETALAEGGCALVVRNTVGRAQETCRVLRATFRGDVLLLHGRLTAAERADRAERVLRQLGPSGDRPQRLIVVATQLAEQSFDVDADVLVSDLAPIDLLLQRVGRIHRHARDEDERPPLLRTPRVVVTGVSRLAAGPPQFPAGSSFIYGDHLLLRAAALVGEALDEGWTLPHDVPELVARGYADEPVGPPEWHEAEQAARERWEGAQALRQGRAQQFLLAGPDELGRPTLAGLHERSIAALGDEDEVAAVVRDGPPAIEVILVRRTASGYATLGGRPLGSDGGTAGEEGLVEELVGSTVRLPTNPTLTDAARSELGPLVAWGDDDPWLRRSRALILDEDASATLGGFRLTYDPELGLISEREGGR